MAQSQGKKYRSAAEVVGRRPYPLEEAVPLVQKVKFAKFDETVELHMRLGVDPSTPTKWCAARWFCPTGWENPSAFW